MEARDHELSLNGVRLHLREWGPVTAPPVLMLHGMTAYARHWDSVAQGLAGQYRLIVPDARGHGESEHAQSYSFELMRDDVLALADHLELDGFRMLGHSMGGTVAYLVAEKQPRRVTRLVIEDTPVPWGGGWTHNLPTGEHDEVYRSPLELARRRPDLPAELRAYAFVADAGGRLVPRHDPLVLPAIVRQLLQPDPAWWDSLTEITAPTLIIAGVRSHLSVDRMRAAADRIPGAELLLLDSGHDVHLERPADFLAAVRSFLA